MKLNESLFERAFAMAERDKVAITEETAEGYFMAALAQEMNMIHELLNTSKGRKATKIISNNMAHRMR